MAYICSLYNLQGGNQTWEKRERDKRRCVGRSNLFPSWPQPLQQQGAPLKHRRVPTTILTRRGVSSKETIKSNSDNNDKKKKYKTKINLNVNVK